MIDVALKYFLTDICIDVCFNRMMSNLKLDNAISKPKVGDFYSRVSHRMAFEVYHNCQVIEVEEIKDSIGNITDECLVYFLFEYKVGDDIEDDVDDDEIRAYIREISKDGSPDMDDLTDDEIEAMLDDDIYDEIDPDDLDGVDLSDVDLIATADPTFVGVNTAFFDFCK